MGPFSPMTYEQARITNQAIAEIFRSLRKRWLARKHRKEALDVAITALADIVLGDPRDAQQEAQNTLRQIVDILEGRDR